MRADITPAALPRLLTTPAILLFLFCRIPGVLVPLWLQAPARGKKKKKSRVRPLGGPINAIHNQEEQRYDSSVCPF